MPNWLKFSAMETVPPLAKKLNIAQTTLHSYADRFDSYLSDFSRERPRRYTADDVKVLTTVAVMRDQGFKWREIKQTLNRGERLDFPENEEPPTAETAVNEEPSSQSPALLESFNRALRSYEGRMTRLENKVDEEMEKRVDAEKRAIKAETERDIYKDQAGTYSHVARRWQWVAVAVLAVGFIITTSPAMVPERELKLSPARPIPIGAGHGRKTQQPIEGQHGRSAGPHHSDEGR